MITRPGDELRERTQPFLPKAAPVPPADVPIATRRERRQERRRRRALLRAVRAFTG